MKEQMTGAQSLIRSLEAVGVNVMFGIPGGAILPAYDPIYGSRVLRHILVRHERGAGHAAEGYAKATGRIGVCMATSGPGATNLVTAITNAYVNEVPMVVVTGQVPSPAIGSDAFQEADIVGITMPVTKHSHLVTSADEIPRVVAEAFHVAGTGRGGPVLIDVPKDLLQGAATFEWPPALDLPGYRPATDATGNGHHGRQTRADVRDILGGNGRTSVPGKGRAPALANGRVPAPGNGTTSPAGPPTAAYVVERLRQMAAPGTVYVSGSGRHQHLAGRVAATDGDCLDSGPLGALGYAVAAAMGAKVGRPDAEVWAIASPECFETTSNELTTCSVEGIAIKVALLNNRQGRRSPTDPPPVPDLLRLAEALGCTALRCEDAAGVDAAIATAADAGDGPVVVEFAVTRPGEP